MLDRNVNRNVGRRGGLTFIVCWCVYVHYVQIILFCLVLSIKTLLVSGVTGKFNYKTVDSKEQTLDNLTSEGCSNFGQDIIEAENNADTNAVVYGGSDCSGVYEILEQDASRSWNPIVFSPKSVTFSDKKG